MAKETENYSAFPELHDLVLQFVEGGTVGCSCPSLAKNKMLLLVLVNDMLLCVRHKTLLKVKTTSSLHGWPSSSFRVDDILAVYERLTTIDIPNGMEVCYGCVGHESYSEKIKVGMRVTTGTCYKIWSQNNGAKRAITYFLIENLETKSMECNSTTCHAIHEIILSLPMNLGTNPPNSSIVASL
jgi:hypothetical protein